jgi:hypothetical protein
MPHFQIFSRVSFPLQDEPTTEILPSPKIHLLVVAMANANFGVSMKLLQTMYLTF